MDLKDGVYSSKKDFLRVIEKYKNKPHIIVDSGNGLHIYWRVKDATRDEYLLIQKALIKKFNTDKSIWTVMQLMRYPGFKNTKDPENYKLAKKISPFKLSSSKNPYCYNDFSDILPLVTKEDDSDIRQHADALDGKIEIEYELPKTNDLPQHFIDEMENDVYIKTLFNEPTRVMGGDRSRVDFNLACRLKRLKYSKEDIFTILYNTVKAQEKKEHHRANYAQTTVNKLFVGAPALFAVENVSEFLKNKKDEEYLGRNVNGPGFLDCLHSKWRTKQMLTMVSGSGIGKTALALKIFSEMIKNNKHNDGLFFYFNLEMLCGEVVDRWQKLNGNDPDCMNRFYAVGANTFEKMGKGNSPNLQTIYKIIKDTEKHTGKKAFAVAIDHVDALCGSVDLKQDITFGAENSNFIDRIKGDITILSKDGICQSLKYLTQMLDVFLIVQSQTTKLADGAGDLVIGKQAAFGTSKLNWYSDYVLGLWRPLNRVTDQCRQLGLFATAFQYTKKREENALKDGLGLQERAVIKFIPEKEDYVEMSDEEMEHFDKLNESAIKIRQAEEKNQSKKYTNIKF